MSVVNRFPAWGKVGEIPNPGFQYDGGDQVNEKHLNFLWDKIQKQTDDFIAETDGLQAQIDGIDANGDGIVDEADTANLYKGNDIDTNGDGKVNSAETADTAGDADTLDGEHASAFADTNHGNEEHSTNFTTLSEVNTSADVPNADYADNAGDADTVDGFHASELGEASQSYYNIKSGSANNESGTYQTITLDGHVTDWWIRLYTSYVNTSNEASMTLRFTFSDGTQVTKSLSRRYGDGPGASNADGQLSDYSAVYTANITQIDFEYDEGNNSGTVEFEWGVRTLE